MYRLGKKRERSPETSGQKRQRILSGAGVQSMSSEHMAHNAMTTQIENFDRSKLKPLRPQQRYIISPHDDVRNLFANSVGMSSWGAERGLPGIRPVFKDDAQRGAFHGEVIKSISSFGPVNDTNKHKMTALNQLKDWSTKDAGMLDFKSINTKRQHPIVYVQGHGDPGSTVISSDSGQDVSARKVGKMLHAKGLPNISEVRANSCFSGTQTKLLTTLPNIDNHFKDQSIDLEHAGDWSKTFAGALQKKLSSFPGRKNRVAGYMGPTRQAASDNISTLSPLGKVEPKRGMAASLRTPGDVSVPYKRGQMKRMEPSYKDKGK